MASSYLQVAGNTIINFGGYGRRGNVPLYSCDGGNCFAGTCNYVEMLDDTCQYIDPNTSWQDVEESGSMTRTYSWRDSNAGVRGENSCSSRGFVTITDYWTASIDSYNNYVVNVVSVINALGRNDPVGNPTGIGRGWAIKDANSGYIFAQGEMRIYDVIANALPREFSISKTFTLAPQTSSDGQYTWLARSWTLGYATETTGREPFVDEMFMGLRFRNNLPKSFNPPSLLTISQEPDICDNNVNVHMTFDGPNLAGGRLLVQWRYSESDDWSDLYSYAVSTTREQDVTITLPDIEPSGCSEDGKTTLYWRAQFQSTVATLTSSDWTYGQFETEFIPPVNMTVPDISVEECDMITRAVEIEEYEDCVEYDTR